MSRRIALGHAFNQPRNAAALEARARAATTDVNVTCDTCGVSLYKVRGKVWRVAPRTHFTLARQAMAAHRKATGCAGHELDANRVGVQPAAAVVEKIAGAELDALAASLGIPREQAAKMASEALGMMGKRDPRGVELETLAMNALAARQRAKPAFEQLADRKPAALGPGVEPGEFTAPSLAGEDEP